MAKNPRKIRAGRAYVEMGVNDNALSIGLKRAQLRLRAFGKSVRRIGQGLFRAGAAATAGFAIPTTLFAGFDDRMRAVRAVTGATEEQFESLREEAKRLGATTSFTASQVADAMTELGRAGFDPRQIMAATEPVLALSRATGTELPRSAEIAGAALRGFNKPASEMGAVADLLTVATNKSSQTLEDLFEAFKPVAPIAAEAGSSMEDVAAAVGILANNGIKGSLAGNALARAYKNLSTTKTQGILKGLGVEAVDSSGDLRDLSDILFELDGALAGSGNAQRLAVFDEIFGRGQASALKLSGAEGSFVALRDELASSAGAARRTAEAMDAGIGGSFRRLLSAVQGVGIEIGEALAKPLARAVDVIIKVAGRIDAFVRNNRELVVGLAKAAVALLAVGGALTALGLAATVAGAIFGGLATVVTTVVAAFKLLVVAIGALLSPAIAIPAVIAFGIYKVLEATGLWQRAIGWLMARFRELGKIVGEVFGGIGEAMQTGDIELAGRIALTGLKIVFVKIVGDIVGVWADAIRKFRELFADGMFAVRGAFTEAMGFLRKKWLDVTTYFERLLIDWTAGFRKSWSSAITWLSKQFTKVMAIFDSELDVERAIAQLDDQSQADLKRIDDEAARKRLAVDRESAEDREKIERDLADKRVAILQDAARKQKEIDVDRARAVALAEIALKGVKDDLNELRGRALEQIRVRELIQNARDDEPDDFSPEGLAKAVAGAASFNQGVQGGRLGVVGTFGTEALRGLFGSARPLDRVTKAAEEAAEAAKKMEQILNTNDLAGPFGGAFA